MTTTTNELKELFLARLQESSGSLFQEHGFKLHKKKWVRKQEDSVNKVVQEINFYMATNPRYRPSAILHITPSLYVLFPEINRIAFELFKGDESLLYNKNGITFGQPVSLLLPKGSNEEIYIENDESSFISGVVKMKERLKDDILPFFNDCKTLKQFTDLYTYQDNRLIMKQAPYYVFQTIAFNLIGDKKGAKKVIEERFYQKIFALYREKLMTLLS